MKKLLLLAVLIATSATKAQVTVFEDGFESYDDFSIADFGGWDTLDLDMLPTYTGGLPDDAEPDDFWPNANDPQAWIVFNPTAAGVSNSTDACTATLESRNFDPHTGLKYAGSWAGVPDEDTGVDANNDWLISPPVSLGTSTNSVSFWVKQLSSCYGTEIFRVGVYVGTGTPTQASDFAFISGFSNVAATTSWVQKTYSLNTYSNQTIRIGIQNKSADAYMLMVDDFVVTSSNLGVNDVLSAKFSTYPNPANDVVNLRNTAGINVTKVQINDLNGRTVKTINFTDAPSDIQINIGDLSAGMYMMNIDSDQGKAVKKIVKN